MARRVNPRGIERPASHRRNVAAEQQSIVAASASVRRRIVLHSAISLWKCAVLAAREPDLSGVGVVVGVLRFTLIFCQPCLAGSHH